MHVNEILAAAVERGASDVHLKVGRFPTMRVDGKLVTAWDVRRLTHEDTAAIAASVMSTVQQQKFNETLDLDLAYSLPGISRFRCNVYQQRGTIALVFRVIPVGVRRFEDLGLPPVLKRIAGEPRGLVLVTGATGSGKSSTLAAMIDHINDRDDVHVITIEDPIEYLHRDRRGMISQRELGIDTHGFAGALRSALRQDPDVILVGEMRDLETVETALMAAETGHLVLSTLHTLDATETVTRVIGVFPPHQRKQVRLQLATTLRAVVSQRLLPRADGKGRVVAVEVMVVTPFIRECIVNRGKTRQIREAIAAGTSQYGMQTFDQSILALYHAGLVSHEECLRSVTNVDEFKLKLSGISSTTDLARDKMAQEAAMPDSAASPFMRFGDT